MSFAIEGPTESRIRDAQFKFGRLMHEINHKITAGDGFVSILDFLFISMDTIIPYDRTASGARLRKLDPRPRTFECSCTI